MTFHCIILGAAGRDFHNFLTFFRANPLFRVCAFTAAQIPFIEQRVFPASLIGVPGAQDIPIFPEADLRGLIARYRADFVFLAYSDLSHAEVMHKAALVQACGASFVLLGPRHTQLQSARTVISVTAVRTGAGKSPLTRRIAQTLREAGRRVVVLRHPMPYGDLEQQRVQRFATVVDLDRHNCTIEEREEFEPYVELGLTVYAGVDYAEILKSADAESDVILWDGGNNDFSFVAPGLSLVVADALRPGHETAYFPGETNFRSADVIVINKVSQASPGAVQQIRDHAEALNPKADVIEADLRLTVEDERTIFGKRVLVVEDGPTLTHGGMSFGAGLVAAKRAGGAEILDPRPFAVGSIADCYRSYPHIGPVLPALGYSPEQRAELEQTIRASDAEVVVDASPARLSRCINVSVPISRVSYEFHQLSGEPLESLVEQFLEEHQARGAQ